MEENQRQVRPLHRDPGDTLAAKVKRTGRYDLATKVEVSAFVGEKMKRLAAAVESEMDRIEEKGAAEVATLTQRRDLDFKILELLERRVGELELSWWARAKRAFSEWLGRMRAPVMDRLPEADMIAYINRERAALGQPALGDWMKPRCEVPPPGWSCSRAAGHDPPCAAQPIEVEDLETQSIEIAEAIRALNNNMFERIDEQCVSATCMEQPELCRYGCGNVHPPIEVAAAGRCIHDEAIDHSDPIAAARAGVAFMATNYPTRK